MQDIDLLKLFILNLKKICVGGEVKSPINTLIGKCKDLSADDKKSLRVLLVKVVSIVKNRYSHKTMNSACCT